MLLPLHSLCALDALRAPPPPNPPPPAGSVAGAFAALAAREEFFDGPSPAPPPASAVLRLWWRTSELEGQWDSTQRYVDYSEWLFASGMPGTPGSLNVYLREGSAALVTQVCGGGEGEWAYAPGGGGGSLAEAAACQAPSP